MILLLFCRLKWWLVLAFATTLLIPAPAMAMGEAPDGTWRGPVTQPGAGPYSIVLTLKDCARVNACGTAYYPELGCTEEVSQWYWEWGGTYHFKTRVISDPRNRCVPNGTATLKHNSGDSWEWVWHLPGSTAWGAWATLKKDWVASEYLIYGVVREGTAGLAGVTVSDSAGHSTVTGADGKFAFTESSSATYTISVRKSGYRFDPAKQTALVPPSQYLTFTGVPGTYKIGGRVRYDGGLAAPGVTVSDGAGHSATTDANGAYEWSLPEAGTYKLTPAFGPHTFNPPNKSYTVPPDVTSADFVMYPYIGGRAVDLNGKPLPGTTVSVKVGSSTQRYTTGPDGRYQTGSLWHGSVAVTPSLQGYVFVPATRSVALPPTNLTVDLIGIATGEPIIRSVQPCVAGLFFVKGVALPNRYDVTVDWRGIAAKSVVFTLNGRAFTAPATGEITSYTFAMGSALTYGVSAPPNELQVVAINAKDQPSAAVSMDLAGVSTPVWLPSAPLLFNAACNRNPVTYKYSLAFPVKPFSAHTTPPAAIPAIGGHRFGLTDTQAKLAAGISTDGTGEVEASGQTGFSAAGQDLTGRLYGEGDAQVAMGRGITLPSARIGLEVGGKIVRTIGVTEWAPALKKAESWPVFGGMIKWFNNAVRAQIEIKPSVAAEVPFHSTNESLQPDGVDGKVGAHMSAAINTTLIENGLSASVYGGGEPALTLKVLPELSLDRFEVELFAGVKLVIWRWEHVFEESTSWSYPPGAAAAGAGDGANAPEVTETASGWRVIPRTYGEGAGYSAFVANAAGAAGVGSEPWPIATNVNPFTHPGLAASADRLVLAWTHDDVNRPPMQGEEIYFSAYDGAAWSTPAGITQDDLQDFAPRVRFDGAGHAVAVWERNRTRQTAGSAFDATYTNDFEIAYAVWDGSAWSQPTYVAELPGLDHAPQLAAGRDGGLMVLWRHNNAGELAGSAEAPDTLYTAEWDGTAWGEPQPLPVADSMSRHLAYARLGLAALVYAAGADIYACTWDGAGWSAPLRLTEDAERDAAPVVFFDGSDAAHLVWLKGEALHQRAGSLTGPEGTVPTPGLAINDFAAAASPAGELALVIASLSAEGPDLFALTYDPAGGTWSLPVQLTRDAALERMPAPAFAAASDLWIAFDRTALVTGDVTLPNGHIARDVTQLAASDLAVLRHRIGPDLAVSAAEAGLAPAEPVVGAEAAITATIRNLGGTSVEDVQVAVYRGAPGQPGAELGRRAVTLAAGAATTVTVPFVYQAISAPYTVVVDADERVPETDETNNHASILPLAADLQTGPVEVLYGTGPQVRLGIRIDNVGRLPAGAFTIDFRLDDPATGRLLGRANVASIAPGSSTTAELAWTGTGVADGWHTVYAIADATRLVTEANEANNTGRGRAGLLADFVPAIKNVGGTYGLALTVTVRNQGPRSGTLPVGLCDSAHPAGVYECATTLVKVAAGGSVDVVLTREGSWWPGLYVIVNPGGAGPELDTNNNRILFGRAPMRVYLPLQARK